MISARLPGWELQVQQRGIVLVSPEGPDAGAITIEERFEPPVSLVRVAEMRGRLIEGPTPVASGDGESGQVIALERPAERGGGREDIGLVLGDIHYTVIVGVTTVSEYFERSRAAVENLTRQIGCAMSVRRRRFIYTTPPGWKAVCRGFETDHYPPGFESDPARLTVFPAIEHRGAGAPDAIAALLEEQLDVSARFADAEWRESMTRSEGGLSFLRSSADVGGRVTELAVAVDSSYIYAFRLEGSAHHRAALDAAVAGVVPLAPAAAPGLTALTHWAE